MNWFRSAKDTPKPEDAIGETLLCDHFQIAKIVCHGFPHRPTALAFDPVQNLLAIGTKSGSIRIIGRPGVDRHIQHDVGVAIEQILFLINEGALISISADDVLCLWSLRQRKPEIIHALKFQKERITFCHLPFQSKWLYIGTKNGNVHILNLESFLLSGYIIYWNKTIELMRRTHPGPVVHMSANQSDPNKLLIGYETGSLTLWDLKNRVAECHYNCTATIKSVSWHHEGRQFICSHGDGSLTTWDLKSFHQPVSNVFPHVGKLGSSGKPETCQAINKVELCTNRSSEPFTVFSGGMPVEKAGQTPTLTIMHGSNITVREMESKIIDFIVLCSTPWNNDFQNPYAVVVLLQHNFIVIDLTSPNYPYFDNPCSTDIHESPVTTCCYFSDCPTDLTPAFYSVGCRQKKTIFSRKEWPIKGGEWCSVAASYDEIIITGHADGSVKFWNAPGVTLQELYELKTAKMFDETQCNCGADDSDFPFAIHIIHLCIESRLLCIAGSNWVSVFRFSKQEATVECTPIVVTLTYDISNESGTPGVNCSSLPLPRFYAHNLQKHPTCVKLQPGPHKWSLGYQPYICCMLTWFDGKPPSPITSVSINSKFGLLVFGSEVGLVVLDILQKTCLLSIGTPYLYVLDSMDSYSKPFQSPKLKSSSRSQGSESSSSSMTPDDAKSPDFEQSGMILASPVQPKSAPCSASNSEFKLSEHSLMPKKSLDSCTEVLSIDKTQTVTKQPPVEHLVDEPCSKAKSTRAFCSIQEECCSESSDNEGSACFSNGDFDENRENELATSDDPFICSPTTVPPGVRRHSMPVGPGKCAKDSTERHRKLSERSNIEIETPNTLPVVLHKDRDSNSGRPFKNPLPNMKGVSLNVSLPAGAAGFDGSCAMVPQTAPVLSKADGLRFVGRMNRRLKSCLKFASGLHNDDKSCAEHPERHRGLGGLSVLSRTHRTKSHDVEVIDLTSDDFQATPFVHKLTHPEFSVRDRTDTGSSIFSLTQRSCISSLDKTVNEAIQCLILGEFCIHKSDCGTSPCLLAGTSLGSVVVLSINLPPDGSARQTEPVSVLQTGTVFRLKGAILTLAFVDAYGVLIPSCAEPWRDPNRDESAKEQETYSTGQQVTSNLEVSSPLSSTKGANDYQFAVLCSEKQARMIAMPSQTCVSKAKVTNDSAAVKANVVQMRGSSCLVCYLQNGRITTFTLPSLKPLLDVDLVSSPNVRVAQTICFGSNCNVLYFCSPSELQKMTLSAEMCEYMTDLHGELFVPRDMPESPKSGFFQNLFSTSSATLDREDLFGERSGKSPKGVAVYKSGISQTQGSAVVTCSEIDRAKIAAIERGEKLGELDEKTAQMMLDAEHFTQRAMQIKNKYKDRKWYQF